MNRKECPNCNSWDTERVYIDHENDIIVEVYICNDCPAEYECHYHLEAKEVSVIHE